MPGRDDYLIRSRLALGEAAFARLRRARVAIFGLGGVGGWCAEALARTGVGSMLLVDFDRVAPSNLNRQLIATAGNLGRLKTEVLAERLAEAAPGTETATIAAAYTPENGADFPLADCNCVIDAIDMLPAKAALIRHALSLPKCTLFSSMGAAGRLDPLRVKCAEFRKVSGDGLARALRRHFRQSGGLPERKFTCVYSDEPFSPDAQFTENGKRVNGSIAPVTGAFGLALAGLVIKSFTAAGDA